MSSFPCTRLRRYRRTESLRQMFSEPLPPPSKFIWPIFIIEGKGKEIKIDSMPGQSRMSIDIALKRLKPVVESGIGGIMIFGVPEDKCKSPDGRHAYMKNGLVQNAVRKIKKTFPDLIVFTDVCLCSYTKHGHCGTIDSNGDVDNDATLETLAKVAVSHAEAGADAVAPSAMMDGQVLAIRDSLSENGFKNILIMSYSTKFASSFYGPFRDAADSKPMSGDRKSYQAPFNDLKQAIRESIEDEKEGADILMVKTALCYLDIISKIKERTLLPVATYNVSGEYSMLIASSERGFGDLKAMVRESTAAIHRSGADIIISYWASRYKEMFEL